MASREYSVYRAFVHFSDVTGSVRQFIAHMQQHCQQTASASSSSSSSSSSLLPAPPQPLGFAEVTPANFWQRLARGARFAGGRVRSTRSRAHACTARPHTRMHAQAHMHTPRARVRERRYYACVRAFVTANQA